MEIRGGDGSRTAYARGAVDVDRAARLQQPIERANALGEFLSKGWDLVLHGDPADTNAGCFVMWLQNIPFDVSRTQVLPSRDSANHVVADGAPTS